MNLDDSEFTEEERDIIGKEAARLRWEFEEDRGKKKRPDVFQAEASQSMAMLADLDRQVKEAMTKKQESLKELRDLQTQLKQNRNEANLNTSHSRVHVEPAPMSHSMSHGHYHAKPGYDSTDHQLLEFKIEGSKRELQNLDDQLASRRKMYENQLGINTAEVLSIIEERDALKKKVSSGEYAFGYLERLELERQINIAKEQIVGEQKHARQNAEKLQDEIDDGQKTIEEFQMSNQELGNKIDYLEKEVRAKVEDSIQREDQFRNEIRELRTEIEDRKVAEHRLSLDAAEKEKLSQDLQMIIMEKEKQISQEHDAKAQLARDKLEEIGNTKAEHASNVRTLTAKMEAEQKAAVCVVERKKCEEVKELVDKQKQEIAEMKASHCKIIENYCFDIETLRKALQDQEQNNADHVRKIKIDFDDDLKSSIHKERMFNEEEQARLLNKEKKLFEEELKRVSTRLSEAVEYEKSQSADLRCANGKLKSDIDDLKEKHKHQIAELVANHEAASEKANENNHHEIEGLRQRLTQDREVEVERLCKQIDELECKLRNLDKEHEDLNGKVDHFFGVFDHHEKTIVCEINDLCKTIAEVLEIDERKVTSKMSHMKPHQMLMNPALQKTTTRNCLANMRATVTDLVNNYGELQKIIHALRHQHKELRKETEQKLNTLTDHLNLAAQKERETLREEMEATQVKIVSELQAVIKNSDEENQDLRKKLKIMENEVEGLHTSMSKWKEETASRLSQTFEHEMKSLYLKRMKDEQEASDLLNKQKLLLKLEDQVSRLRAEQALGRSQDPSTIKLIGHLQDRIRSIKLDTAGVH